MQRTIPKRTAKPSPTAQVDVVIPHLVPAIYTTDLTKREYFATVAMQGLLSQHVATRVEYVKPGDFQSQPIYKAPFKNSMNWDEVEELARGAVIIAEALIAELNKHPQK